MIVRKKDEQVTFLVSSSSWTRWLFACRCLIRRCAACSTSITTPRSTLFGGSTSSTRPAVRRTSRPPPTLSCTSSCTATTFSAPCTRLATIGGNECVVCRLFVCLFVCPWCSHFICIAVHHQDANHPVCSLCLPGHCHALLRVPAVSSGAVQRSLRVDAACAFSQLFRAVVPQAAAQASRHRQQKVKEAKLKITVFCIAMSRFSLLCFLSVASQLDASTNFGLKRHFSHFPK